MRRIDERKDRIVELGKAVQEYTGVNVYNIGPASQRDKRIYEATALFSKWGLEHGINGLYLSQYMGKYKDAAGRTRLAFTRAFEKQPDRKELYYKFCQYVSEAKE